MYLNGAPLNLNTQGLNLGPYDSTPRARYGFADTKITITVLTHHIGSELLGRRVSLLRGAQIHLYGVTLRPVKADMPTAIKQRQLHWEIG